MEILETKILKEDVNGVEVFGVISTFNGNIAGIISNGNGRECNVVIAYSLEKIEPEDRVFPISVSRKTAEDLYKKLR